MAGRTIGIHAYLVVIISGKVMWGVGDCWMDWVRRGVVVHRVEKIFFYLIIYSV